MKLKVDIEQPSTWRGFVYLVTGVGSLLGLTVSTELAFGIIGVGLSIAGAIGFSVPDVNDIKKSIEND
jgi:hypothetical protein